MAQYKKAIQKTPTLYLNIIWHQHQPFYVDPQSDQLQGPWVRTHGTKDYYDMAAMLQHYPAIHCTINLTSSLLYQLEEYYVKRLKPFVYPSSNSVDAEAFFRKYRGKTDPWIDIALTQTERFSEKEIRYLLTNVWNAFGISTVQIERFPQYRELQKKYQRNGVKGLSVQDMREIKFWFFVAHFDPDFLEQPTKLITGEIIDLTDIIRKHKDGTYSCYQPITEALCNRVVAETVKILSAIVPIHKHLMYNPRTRKGQIELITTPYYHPILPLLYNSDIARICQPHDPLPARFAYPQDAEAHVVKSIQYFRKLFGVRPHGMWPAEGSVSQDVLSIFAKHGIQWIATDEKILANSKADNHKNYYPYVSTEVPIVVVFRHTELSDKIGFVYKDYNGRDAALDFIHHILTLKPREGEQDRLLTVILDGENAWEWYKYDNDGKTFQHTLYQELTRLYEAGEVITTTVSEYMYGNPSRGIPPHPPTTYHKIDWLWPGSWINANYDTWIGDDEENQAWEYLRIAREDLEKSNLPPPDLSGKKPKKGTREYYTALAWESLYAAEGSDWFWWYGTDQSAPAGDKPFDVAFITHLNNIYHFAKLAGATIPARTFPPIAQKKREYTEPSSTMAQSRSDLVTVVFRCNAKGMYVRKAIYITGNHALLGNWVPNKIQMYDDGTHGDERAGDNIWTLELQFPRGTVIEYKYTNSGPEGGWYPGEEFPALNRRILVDSQSGNRIVLLDTFGKI